MRNKYEIYNERAPNSVPVILGNSGQKWGSRLTSCYCVYMGVMYATQIGVPVRGEVGREILDLV